MLVPSSALVFLDLAPLSIGSEEPADPESTIPVMATPMPVPSIGQ